MAKPKVLTVAALATLLVPAVSVYYTTPASAADFGDPAFQRVWTRTDKPVADKTVVRSWYWGPVPGETKTEKYAEGAGGTRKVQYFDKSRMEINDPNADKNNPFFVTNGLLTVELISGKMQVGKSQYETRYSANIALGDVDDQTGPTYATFKLIANSPLGDHPAIDQTGKLVVQNVNRAGIVARDPATEKYGVKYGFYNAETKHNIADKFWDFLNLSGPVVGADGKVTNAKLSDPWFYTTGYAISEPYWSRMKVAGQEKDILVQLFERRALTYDPTSPVKGFEVQMGNIGAHYYDWRYKDAGQQAFPNPTVSPVSVPAGALGSPDNPIRMAFVPSANSTKVLASGEPLGKLLGQVTGYSFKVSVPTSYAAVIEAMGSNNVEVAWLAPFSYALANQKYGAQVILSTVRKGSLTYPSVFITADPSVKSVADLKGKKFAYVDPASASGYLYPYAYLKGLGFDPKTFFSETVFAGGHDKVVTAVYNGQVAGGACFGGPLDPQTGAPTDARSLIAKTKGFEDVYQKVHIIGETQQIPNDTVSVRKGLDPAMVKQIQNGLLSLTNRPDGRSILYDLYAIDDLAPVNDAFYDPLRQVAQDAGITNFETLFPTPVPPTPTAVKP